MTFQGTCVHCHEPANWGEFCSTGDTHDLGATPKPAEKVNHPAHYNDSPSGVECIEVVRHMNFNVGNAVKYLWRCGKKGGPLVHRRRNQTH